MMTRRLSTGSRLSQWACALALLIANVAISWPLVRANSKYFYQEDDAHHFNRTVEMAKYRDLNPHYFNKPALHFYLRMPVVYMSVLWEKRQGRLNSLQEVRTRSPHGLAGYAFSASHPMILIWNRLLSVLWSALLPVLVFALLCANGVALWVALFGAVIPILSPEVLRNSYIIGVDTLMALMCFLCSVCALSTLRCYSWKKLAVTAIVAGLACAAKYNAAPIALVPLGAWWLCDRNAKSLLLMGLCVGLGFFLGAPYSLLSYREFFSGVSYEIWHYGVAGHDQHIAQPGLPQAAFYLRWLISDGVGLLATILILPGLYSMYRSNKQGLLVFLLFPVGYAVLMVMQRANFTRNMVVIVPYAACLAAYGLQFISSKLSLAPVRWALAIVIPFLTLSYLGCRSAQTVINQQLPIDSRDTVEKWLLASRPVGADVAVAGKLQLPFSALSLPGVDTFNIEKNSLASLIQAGYKYVVVPSESSFLDASYTEIEQSISGEAWPQRLPHNPALVILRVAPAALEQAAALAPSALSLSEQHGTLRAACNSDEPHCWISALLTTIRIPPSNAPSLEFETMSPWPNQKLEILSERGELLASTAFKSPGQWQTIQLPASSTEYQNVRFRISELHSPASLGQSSDTRRLGIAIKRS